jgi:RNA polymerase sigma-70 factor (ECF subfamily)
MPISDGELILGISQGDQRAFDQLFTKYQKSVYRFVYYLTQNSNKADDLFQDTWLRVVKYLPGTSGLRDIKAWIFRIAINLHRDELRKQRIRRPFRSQRLVTSEYDGDEPSNLYHSIVPVSKHDLETIDIGPAINRAIAQLPVKQRRVFILKEIEGFKHREISNILGLPVGTIKSLLHRAIKHLQKELADYRYV